MGAIEQARGGTLFLDEVESLPLSFQYKLAQVLHENRFSRLGEEGRVQVDCRIILASETGIVAATRTILERVKTVVEPSAAVPLAALLENDAGVGGRRVGIVLSGGNLDLDNLPW